MSRENVIKFYEEVKNSENLKREFEGLRNQVESGEEKREDILAKKIVSIAKGNGFDFTEKELLNYMGERTEALSEEDLLNVSGGLSPKAVGVGMLGALMLSFASGAALTTSAAPSQGGTANSISASVGSKEESEEFYVPDFEVADKKTIKVYEKDRYELTIKLGENVNLPVSEVNNRYNLKLNDFKMEEILERALGEESNKFCKLIVRDSEGRKVNTVLDKWGRKYYEENGDGDIVKKDKSYVSEFEVTEKTKNDDGLYDVKIKFKKSNGQIRLDGDKPYWNLMNSKIREVLKNILGKEYNNLHELSVIDSTGKEVELRAYNNLIGVIGDYSVKGNVLFKTDASEKEKRAEESSKKISVKGVGDFNLADIKYDIGINRNYKGLRITIKLDDTRESIALTHRNIENIAKEAINKASLLEHLEKNLKDEIQCAKENNEYEFYGLSILNSKGETVKISLKGATAERDYKVYNNCIYTEYGADREAWEDSQGIKESSKMEGININPDNEKVTVMGIEGEILIKDQGASLPVLSINYHKFNRNKKLTMNNYIRIKKRLLAMLGSNVEEKLEYMKKHNDGKEMKINLPESYVTDEVKEHVVCIGREQDVTQSKNKVTDKKEASKDNEARNLNVTQNTEQKAESVVKAAKPKTVRNFIDIKSIRTDNWYEFWNKNYDLSITINGNREEIDLTDEFINEIASMYSIDAKKISKIKVKNAKGNIVKLNNSNLKNFKTALRDNRTTLDISVR